ncbi:porimin [Monodon monoceros]|uniref:Transmembrane protein 123 n=2 Tax=Monodon monoceros TaxID=40151 RepID=A0A8C6C5Y4_MONMO|nr:porimin [Monodon monoceros]
MGLGSRGILAVLALGVVVGVALLKIIADSTDPEGSPGKKNPMSVEDSNDNPIAPQVLFSHTGESSNFNVKPSKTPVSPVSKMTATTSKPIAKPSTTAAASVSNNGTATTLKTIAKPSTILVASVSNNGTATTSKPIATSKMITPEVSTNMTSTTLRSTLKITSVSQNISQIPTSTMTTTHNSSVTSVSSSVTITATIISKENKGSKFDTGSFVGGIVLTLGVLSFLYIGCKMYYSRRGIRYRTIDEHDAII